MNLLRKKKLAARTFKVGTGSIVFNVHRLDEIKDAITKQDMRDLKEAGAIIIKEKSGRRTIVKRKTRRRAGSIKKKVKMRKYNYMVLTRKLRSYLKTLKRKNKISPELFTTVRKEIRAKSLKSLAHLKQRLVEVKK